MNVRVVLFLFMLPCVTLAQGFAGLGTDAEGFETPAPGKAFVFPRDHGAHPDYRIEWWYLTANLSAPDGSLYGLQWTLFRSALQPGLPVESEQQIWMGHAAVTTPDAHLSTERFARGGTGQAGVRPRPFSAWIDDWAMEGETFEQMNLRASAPDFAYDMTLMADGPLVFHGDGGYSVKSAAGQASYYYSQPFFHIEGTLRLPGGEVPLEGQAWLDREWSSQPLADDQAGLSLARGDRFHRGKLDRAGRHPAILSRRRLRCRALAPGRDRGQAVARRLARASVRPGRRSSRDRRARGCLDGCEPALLGRTGRHIGHPFGARIPGDDGL